MIIQYQYVWILENLQEKITLKDLNNNITFASLKLKYMYMTYTTNKTKASITASLFLASKQWSIFPLHKTLGVFHTIPQTVAQCPQNHKDLMISFNFMHSK